MLKIVLFLMITTAPSMAAVGKVATQEQLDKFCVPLDLDRDGDVHWFYYKNIMQFGPDEIVIAFGKGLKNFNHITVREVLNYDQAKEKYEQLSKERP